MNNQPILGGWRPQSPVRPGRDEYIIVEWRDNKGTYRAPYVKETEQ